MCDKSAHLSTTSRAREVIREIQARRDLLPQLTGAKTLLCNLCVCDGGGRPDDVVAARSRPHSDLSEDVRLIAELVGQVYEARGDRLGGLGGYGPPGLVVEPYIDRVRDEHTAP
jgi:hypothetical protein